MRIIRQVELSKSDKIQVLELWNSEYPENLRFQSISFFEKYLNGLIEPLHTLIIDDGNEIRGWGGCFVRDEEKWFAMILDSSIHGQGWGTRLLSWMKEVEVELNGWVIDHNNDHKIDGGVYKSPLNFYLKNGFTQLSGTRLELDIISAVKIKWVNELESKG